MIDLANEQLLTRAEAVKMLTPLGHKALHPASLYRWMLKGKRGVVLESTVVGTQRMTSVEAIQRFSDLLNIALGGQPTHAQAHARQVRKESFRHKVAMAELEAMGVV